MRRLFFLPLFLFSIVFSQKTAAQELQQPGKRNIIRCYTVEVINQLKQQHPRMETDAQFENWLNAKLQAQKKINQRVLITNYTIPIIFHIIYNGDTVGSASNISARAVKEQMLQLNKDFANQSNSPYAVAANSGIQFVLATKDNAGNTLAEPGIERINTSSKGWNNYNIRGFTNAYIDSVIKPQSIWPVNKYYNVWVIPSIKGGSSELLGYATFPVSSTLPGLFSGETDTTAGVVIQTGTLGSIFSPQLCGISYGSGKTLSHETGHFLGLRHIWGDAKCGNDYCDDTPVHAGANSGVPTHPKANSCGTADEMFENYMDYSDDIVLNTFTTNQVDRMQTVMQNSPRRVGLASSSVTATGLVTTASNQVAFANCTGGFSVAETGTTGGYPRYQDLNFTLNVQDKATGPATLTLLPTGSAINTTQYQLLTPTLAFIAGDNAKNVRVRIFDNAEVDGNRNIILGYTIAGTGISAGANAQTLTINISDDDSVKIGSKPITVYKEDFGTTGGNFPAGWLAGSFATPTGLNKWRVGANGGAGITGQALYITDTTTKLLRYNVDSASDAVAITPKIDGRGYANASISFNYKSNGEADSNGIYDYGTLMYSYNNRSFYLLTDTLGNEIKYQGKVGVTNTGNILLPATFRDSLFSVGFRWINDDNTGNNPPFLVDDISVTVNPFTIDTAVSNSYAFDVRAGAASNSFRSTANNSTLINLSGLSTNVAGITAKIIQSGTGTVAFTTPGGSFQRTRKVFQISPQTTNGTATYQATLYFTQAELAAWGSSRLSLKILKVKDGVDLNSTLNAGNSELITPSVFEDATAGYIAYSGNFTGFSQFMLVSANTSLPELMIDFSLVANTKSISINWNTAIEMNNRGFFIERSTDQINYTQIAFVNSKGNSSLPTSYSFIDNFVQPNVIYYYRLRQISNDNRQAVSLVRNAKINSITGIEVIVSPNPAKDFIKVFIKGTTNTATIDLLNPAGQRVQRVTGVNAYNSFYQFKISNYAQGVYTVVVNLPEGSYAKKIIIR